MKNFIKTALFFGLCFFSTQLFAQIPVTDAAAGAQMTALNTQATAQNETLASQLSTAGSQLTQLEKSLEQMKKMADKIEKVNNAVKGVSKIEEFIKMQTEIIKNVRIVKSTGKNVDTKGLSNLLNATSAIITNVTKVLSNDFLNLNDKERVDAISGEKKQMAINLVRSRIILKSVQ